MLKNYIKIAWKVLKRRKFFTFISLFGISFTIVVLMVAAAMLDNMINPGGTEVNQSRILIADRLLAQSEHSTYHNSPGYMFLNKYVRTLTTSKLVSIHSGRRFYPLYQQSKKLGFSYMFTDDSFWRIYKFIFLKGRSYNNTEYNNAAKIAVITRHTAETYFSTLDAIGKYMEVDGSDYRVAGIVENVSVNNHNTYADIWIPNTTSKESLDPQLMGGFNASILSHTEEDFIDIKKEFHKNLRASLEEPLFKEKKMDILKCPLKSRDDVIYSMFIHQNENLEENSTEDESPELNEGIGKSNIVFAGVGFLMLLFMLLPSINLVNINLSRMTERTSEIGVRKAFGASKNILVGQFLVENLILTFIGGAISIILTIIVLHIINMSGYIPYTTLTLDPGLFVIGLLICTVFGFISGVYPAYRMSKLHAVDALRGGE